MTATDRQRAISALRLDVSTTQAVGWASSGYADLLLTENSSQAVGVLLRAATLKLLAAGSWSLTAPERCYDAYRSAADLYYALGRPHRITSGICAGLITGHWEDGRTLTTPTGAGYAALAVAWLASTGSLSQREARESFNIVREASIPWGPHPVGVTRAGLDLFLQFGEAVLLSTERHRSRETALQPVLGPLLSRMAEPVKIAMTDYYHWTRLVSGMLPVDPELMAVGRISYLAVPSLRLETTLDRMGIGQGIDRVPIWLARSLPPPTRGPSRPRPREPQGPSIAQPNATAAVRDPTDT